MGESEKLQYGVGAGTLEPQYTFSKAAQRDKHRDMTRSFMGTPTPPRVYRKGCVLLCRKNIPVGKLADGPRIAAVCTPEATRHLHDTVLDAKYSDSAGVV